MVSNKPASLRHREADTKILQPAHCLIEKRRDVCLVIHHDGEGIGGMTTARLVVERRKNKAALLGRSFQTIAMCGQSIKPDREVFSVPFDRSQRNIDDGTLGETPAQFMRPQ